MAEQIKDIQALGSGSGGGDGVASENKVEMVVPPAPDPDLPPESILVRIGSGRDPFWADGAAATLYERDDSTKGNTNPKAQAQAHQQHASHNSKPRSNSQRYSGSLQPKPPIIGIPGKIQHHSGYLGRSCRRPTDSRIFPKKSPRVDAAAAAAGGGGRKSAVPDEEPGSPKISCIGKVLSERERDRCRRQCRRLREEGKEERMEQPAGCWASLTAVFCCGSGGARATRPASASAETSPSVGPAAERRTKEEPAVEPPALGAMRRFTSGRRTGSWGGDGEVGLELETEEWGGRRSVGSMEEAEMEREATNGSASV